MPATTKAQVLHAIRDYCDTALDSDEGLLADVPGLVVGADTFADSLTAILEDIAVWVEAWEPPACDRPFDYR